MTTGSQGAAGPAVNAHGALVPQRILLDLRLRDKAALLSQLAEVASAALGLPLATILAVLQKREALGSTGVGNGIALPHAAIAGLGGPFGLLVRLQHAIDYGAVDDRPVDLVFLLLTPPNDPKADLSHLSSVARTLRSAAVLKALRKVSSEAEAQAVFSDAK